MNNRIIHIITFVLAFCSIVYEFIMAQALSAFLENTVLRYSVTIGLYMFSMGFGALIAEGKLAKHPLLTLLRVEILLTIIGGFSIILLHCFDMLNFPRLVFSICAHMLIIAIGILSGFEIPLLIELSNARDQHSENKIIGVNYFGAFVGTMTFAFIFYPKIGLVPTAFFIGLLNASAGLLLVSQKSLLDKEVSKSFDQAKFIQILLFIIILVCLIASKSIGEFFINQYLG